MKSKKPKRNEILIIIVVLIISILMITIFINILKPAYYSYLGNCKSNGYELIVQAGYMVGGQTTGYENETPEVHIFVEDNRVIRHEYCHANQILQHRAFDCSSPFGNYINELECYTLQYIPIPIK